MVVPAHDIAFAYELRQEYGMCWKRIAQLTGYEPELIYHAVYRALRRGVRIQR